MKNRLAVAIRSSQVVTSQPLYNPRVAGFPRFNVFSAYPSTMRCTLPYSEVQGINTGATANTLGTAVKFVPNSLFAPLASGHQPYTYDQLCSATGPYTKYKVLGFRVKLTFINNTANAANIPILIRLVNITDNYDITGKLLEDALEKPGSKMIVCPQYGPGSVTTSIAVDDLSVLFNWSREQFTADRIESVGAYGSSPASLVGLHVATSNPVANAAAPLNMTCEFLFDVQFSERQMLPSS